MVAAENPPVFSNVSFMQEVNFEKKSGSFRWEIALSCATQECDMFQHLIIQFSFYYLSSGHLREVKNTERDFFKKLLALKVVEVDRLQEMTPS